MRLLSRNLILVTLAMAASGCGSSSSVWVQGRLTKGGAKYEAPADQKLSITFYSMEPFKDESRSYPAGEPFLAAFKPEDGTFTVAGPDGRGIPPGKYRVSLTQKLTREAVAKKNEKVSRSEKQFDRDTDMLNDQYGDKSPIVRDIQDSSEVVVDLDKPAA